MDQKKTKLYRKRYLYLMLPKNDLIRLIELFQVYCVTPTILLGGRRIETPADLDLLTDPVAPEFIATGLAPQPHILNPITGASSVLQLRMTEKRADLFVSKDAVAEFQELINQITTILDRCIDSDRRMRAIMLSGIIGVLSNVLTGPLVRKLDHQASLANYLCFSFFNICFIWSIIGLITWIWSARLTKTPVVILSLDDRQAKALSERARNLDRVLECAAVMLHGQKSKIGEVFCFVRW